MQSISNQIKLEVHGIELDVDYTYHSGERMVMYYSDMSGHPGCPPEVEIENVWIGEQLIDTVLLDRHVLDTIEEIIIEKHD